MTKFKSQYDKRPVKDGHYPCDDYREGDGVDPRFESQGHRKVDNRKARQLCAQVADSLNLALSEMADEYLRDLYVDRVIPAPDSSQLLATLILPEQLGASEVLASLQRASGKLRTEIAASIHRKRVPQIKYLLK